MMIIITYLYQQLTRKLTVKMWPILTTDLCLQVIYKQLTVNNIWYLKLIGQITKWLQLEKSSLICYQVVIREREDYEICHSYRGRIELSKFNRYGVLIPLYFRVLHFKYSKSRQRSPELRFWYECKYN